MKVLGISFVPLDNELIKPLLQEKYWRIPSALHFDTIRKRREIIIKATNKELIIDTTEAVEVTPDIEIVQRADESSDDDDLFDNLRKMRENSLENVINKSVGASNEMTRNRKRARSESDDEDSRGKMHKIDEDDESVANDDNDDILSFAKRTLQHEDLPDSEDIISNIPKLDSGKYA